MYTPPVAHIGHKAAQSEHARQHSQSDLYEQRRQDDHSLGVTHVQLDKADTLVGTALGAAIFSSAFVQVGDCIYDRVYARVYAR